MSVVSTADKMKAEFKRLLFFENPQRRWRERRASWTMTWNEKLRLKGMAEEDIYFARRDRELIDAMHKRKSAKQCPTVKGSGKKVPKD